MSHRARRITKAISDYDYDLYAKDDHGTIRIYRKCKELHKEKLTYDLDVLNIVRNDYLVMSLTDTWGVRGKAVDWGIEPILARIKALDLWNSDNLSSEFFKQEEKDELARGKAFRNNVESFLYDFKAGFAKATNDINTSNMSKLNKGV
jgi:hypothetical protein